MSERDNFEQMLVQVQMSEAGRVQCLSNYDFLQCKKGELTGKWAAALDGKIYEADRLDDLETIIKDLPGAEFSYTEQLKS